eukprot:TRINITY_DN979_c0_g1_i1.p2 TRINITY_DN979_c0_g1~~TRINITY_DN979_c0_g1_i1.p2  ORF type:complete len:189 (-),score=64.30 TRINITY_DN979_c0_g1_i1:1072-1638(-)
MSEEQPTKTSEVHEPSNNENDKVSGESSLNASADIEQEQKNQSPRDNSPSEPAKEAVPPKQEGGDMPRSQSSSAAASSTSSPQTLQSSSSSSSLSPSGRKEKASKRKTATLSRLFSKKDKERLDDIEISEPRNFREGVHVTFDPETQNFSGVPEIWRNEIGSSGKIKASASNPVVPAGNLQSSQSSSY